MDRSESSQPSGDRRSERRQLLKRDNFLFTAQKQIIERSEPSFERLEEPEMVENTNVAILLKLQKCVAIIV